jgi:hypothetical protein
MEGRKASKPKSLSPVLLVFFAGDDTDSEARQAGRGNIECTPRLARPASLTDQKDTATWIVS